MIKRFFKWLWKEANRPMTDAEYDGMMTMMGAKKCPHCDKFIHRSPE